jgi:hypothetical protein
MPIPVRWIALLPFAWICSGQQDPAQQDVARQIGQLASPGRAEALGAKLLRESRAPAAAAAAVWQTGDQAVRTNARIVLNEMEEAALDPLLKANGNLEPNEQVWRMTMVVETIGDLRKSAAVMLDRQLSNKQAAPLPSMVGAEGHDPPRRVCDAAYVQMSRLTAADPHSEAFVLRMRQFERMPEAGRDAEIQRARQSAGWRNLLR